MTRDEMLQDLAYARALAEEGRHAPLIGGSYSVMFGVLLTLAYAMQWAILSGIVPVAPSMIGAIWLMFGIIAPIGSALLSRRVRRMPGGAAIPNRVDRLIWQGVLWALMAVVAATIARALFAEDFTAPNAIVAAGFGLYGVAIYTTAAISGHTWQRPFAFIAWGVSGTLWYFLHEPWTYLFAAIASIVVLIVPGLLMMRNEPSAIV